MRGEEEVLDFRGKLMQNTVIILNRFLNGRYIFGFCQSDI